MSRLIDTSVLIELVKRGEFLEGSISVITLLEFLRGVPGDRVVKVKKLLEEAFPVLPIDNPVVLEYHRLYASLRERGALLPDADLLIAATALANGLTLVTRDRGFRRLEALGLDLELWAPRSRG